MNPLTMVAMILVIVGGLNWGLVGAADFNLVSALFGETFISSIVYILVGISAIYLATAMPKMVKK